MKEEHDTRGEVRTAETVFFKLASVSTAVVLKFDSYSALGRLRCLGGAWLGRAHVAQHERHHEQRDEPEPTWQHATELMIRARPQSVHLSTRACA
jgi:hypothetical protein